MIPAYFSKSLSSRTLSNQLIESPMTISFKDMAVGLIFGTAIGTLAYFLSKRRFPAVLIFSAGSICGGAAGIISMIAQGILTSKAGFKAYAETKALADAQAATERARALPAAGASIPQLERNLATALRARHWANTPQAQQRIDANIAEIRALIGVIVAGAGA